MANLLYPNNAGCAGVNTAASPGPCQAPVEFSAVLLYPARRGGYPMQVKIFLCREHALRVPDAMTLSREDQIELRVRRARMDAAWRNRSLPRVDANHD